jgi:hypothetical protein
MRQPDIDIDHLTKPQLELYREAIRTYPDISMAELTALEKLRQSPEYQAWDNSQRQAERTYTKQFLGYC